MIKLTFGTYKKTAYTRKNTRLKNGCSW